VSRQGSDASVKTGPQRPASLTKSGMVSLRRREASHCDSLLTVATPSVGRRG